MKDYTVELLRAIAQRLSGRQNCRKVEYEVYIGIPPEGLEYVGGYDFSTKVFFYPKQVVFPNTHRRQQTDLINVVQHIIETQFYDTLFDHYDEYGEVCIKPECITAGAYKYVLSFDKKRRQWIRMY